MDPKALPPRRRRPAPFQLSQGTANRMEEIIASAMVTWLEQFTGAMFPDMRETTAQDCILRGIATGVRRYENVVGAPIVQTLALNLLDTQE